MRQRQKLYSQGGTLQVMKWCINELFFTSSLKMPYHSERPTAYSQYQFQCIHRSLSFFRFRGKTVDDEWRFNKSVEASKLLRPLSPSPRSNLGFNIESASIHHDDLKTTFVLPWWSLKSVEQTISKKPRAQPQWVELEHLLFCLLLHFYLSRIFYHFF